MYAMSSFFVVQLTATYIPFLKSVVVNIQKSETNEYFPFSLEKISFSSFSVLCSRLWYSYCKVWKCVSKTGTDRDQTKPAYIENPLSSLQQILSQYLRVFRTVHRKSFHFRMLILFENEPNVPSFFFFPFVSLSHPSLTCNVSFKWGNVDVHIKYHFHC